MNLRFLTFYNLQPHSTLQRQRGLEEEEEEEEEPEGEEEDEDEEAEEEDEEEIYESERGEQGRHTGRQSYAVQYAEMRRRQK